MKTCDADVAYPFLDAVGASLVEGLIVGDVIADLIVGEGFEGDIGSDGKAAFRLTAEHTDTGSDLMGTSADESQHPCGICLVGGFTQNLVAHDDHSIGCDHEFVVGKGGTIGIGLLASDIKGHLRHRQIVRITLVDILQHPHLEGQTKTCQQLLTTRRITRQNYMMILHFSFIFCNGLQDLTTFHGRVL